MCKIRRPDDKESWDKTFEGTVYVFDCPGCGKEHGIPVTGPKAWGFNGDVNSPTFTPSLKVTHGGNKDIPPYCCHSFIRDGRIQFLNDCTHKLKGQTVPLTDIPHA